MLCVGIPPPTIERALGSQRTVQKKKKKKDILFISQTDLVKYLQMPVNASNLEKFPLFTPKGYPIVSWFI